MANLLKILGFRDSKESEKPRDSKDSREDSREKTRKRVQGGTLYDRMGKSVARPSSNRKTRKKRSLKQLAHTLAFKGERLFFSAFRVVMMLDYPAWNLFAEWMNRKARTGDNLFYAINHKYMDGNKVGAPELFHFSIGELSLPWDMTIGREGDIVVLTWHDERDCPHARANDRLLVGLLYDEFRDRPIVINPRALRSGGSASITLDPTYGTRAHLYPFFERHNCNAYSEDRHFLVE